MTKTRFIGDVHGYKNELALVLNNIPDNVTSVVQVGDMGVGMGQSDYWHESLEDMLQAVNGRFIRGNHDSPSQCKEMHTWINDGRIENDVMFIGGAWSIDYQWRTEGLDWWRDEELSTEQFYGLISVYDYVRPRVMVTHDCPLSVSNKLFIERGKSFSGAQYKTRTGSALEEMFTIHKPALWIFGHWHCNTDEVIDGTRFICLNELSYADINLKTLEVDFPELQAKRGKP
jgi:predicted phosphodiesterase